MGALEEQVMDFLWSADVATTPSEVHAGVAPELAYTTVMTIMTRLWEKGRLRRARQGRGYVYEPVRSEAEHRAGEMRTTLGDSGDRAAVLSQFVSDLDAPDASMLRELLSRRK